MRSSTSLPLRDLVLLAAPLLIGLAWSWPLLDPRYLPLHESLFLAESFHYIYSHLAESHSFPYWIPALDYGVPSTIQFFSVMGPSRTVMAAIGLLLGLHDALLLLKLSFLLDQAILTIGTWLLARELFREPGAIFLTTLGAAFLGHPWLLLYQFNLGIAYLLPLQLFLVVRGCRLHHLGHLLAAISLAAFAYYFVGVHLLIQFIVFLFARSTYAWPWRAVLVPNRGGLAGIVLLLAWAAVPAAFYWHISRTATFLHGQEGRVGPFVPLGEFLTYGDAMISQPRWLHLLGGAMDFTRVRVSGYTGWLPLAALAYAAFTVRSRLFFGLGLATLVTAGLSAGGAVAALSYLFPFMQLARHLGHLGGVIGVMLVVTAGFGLERLLRAVGVAARRRALWSRLQSLPTRIPWGLAGALTLYALDTIGAFMIHTEVLPLAEAPHHAFWAWPIAYAIRLAAYGALGLWVWWRFRGATPPHRLALTGALGLALMLDVGLFHTLERRLYPVLGDQEQALIAHRFTAHSQPFQPRREALTREQAEQQKYFGLSILDGGGPLTTNEDVRNATHHATLGLEGCQNAWDTLLISKNAAVLLEAMGIGAREHPDFARAVSDLPEPDKRILGCQQPKLRLLGFAQGRLEQSPAQAIGAFLDRDGAAQVVLRSAAQSRLQPLAGDLAARALLPAPPADGLTAQLQTFREDRFFERGIDMPFALDLSFQRPFRAQSYTMRCGPYGADSRDRMPLAWRLLGSQDGTSWREIAQVRDAPQWHNRETRQYPIDAAAAYAHYRLVVEQLAAGDVLRLNQFALSPVPLAAKSAPPAKDRASPAGEIAAPMRFDANLLTAEVTVVDPRGAWLVYADAFNPYWKARLDGARAELLEADLGFKAISVPPGRHRATFYYDDPIARGLYRAFTLFPVLFLLALARIWRHRRST